jgi:acyl-CoA synthetase (AMP-forming)/AMP-acid ligase II
VTVGETGSTPVVDGVAGPRQLADLRIDREPWLGTESLSFPGRVPTVVDALDRAVQRFGDREAFIDGHTRVTYAEFAELVEGAAVRLQAEGLAPGDALGVALRNSLELAVALFACARGRFVMVGLNVRLRAPQWAYMLSHSGAGLALAEPDLIEELSAAATDAGLPNEQAREVGDHLTGQHRPWAYGPEQRPDEAATLAVVYTSGTTGRPKASQVVHRASMHSAHSYTALLGLHAEDRTAVLFPLSYISGLHAHVLPMMLVGGASVLLADADPGEFVEVLRTEAITYVYTVPSFWLMLLREPGFRSPELDHVRLGAFGGAPFPTASLSALAEALPKAGWVNIYGLSETHSPATMLLPGEHTAKEGSVGRPLPCMEAKVVDDAGAALAPGEAGELLLRGSLVTTGYFADPESTAAAIDDDGWLATGDVARLDDDGYVWILDRKKDMITRGGYKIFSVEVEQLLTSHPGIADAAVVGIPDPVAYEAVACYVVPEHTPSDDGAGPQDGSVTRQQVQHWVAERMSDYAVPRQVRVVDEIPRNRIGKADKVGMRQQLVAESPALRRRLPRDDSAAPER